MKTITASIFVILISTLTAATSYAGPGCVEGDATFNRVEFMTLDSGLAAGLTTVAEMKSVDYGCGGRLKVLVNSSAPKMVTADLVVRDEASNILSTIRVHPTSIKLINESQIEINLNEEFKNSILTLRVGGHTAGAYLIQ